VLRAVISAGLYLTALGLALGRAPIITAPIRLARGSPSRCSVPTQSPC
jgi:hypothetical protein